MPSEFLISTGHEFWAVIKPDRAQEYVNGTILNDNLKWKIISLGLLFIQEIGGRNIALQLPQPKPIPTLLIIKT